MVHDGVRWHLFATGCGLRTGLEIAHYTAASLDGTWSEREPVRLVGVDHIAHPSAPGVIAEGDRLHMYLQHDFNVLGGHIEHLMSHDGGATFVRQGVALESLAGTCEAGVYDPDPAEIGGERYLTYAAMSQIGQPDIFVARSVTGEWGGPFERCGRMLGHDEVEYHNQIDDEDYEWGLEGPHLVEMPDGTVLLTAVCFLADQPRGARQRLLLATAERPTGPFELLGALIDPAGHLGENGHGTSVVAGNDLHVVYQERSAAAQPWHVRHAVFDIDSLTDASLRKAS
ncbi:MAG TPA: hypothetical protein VMZ22_08035 [Acidimicrobiales bacterium]|nr:hypothetical protein [Acidimicrobiales bacterium]